jgi:regulator of protease activity HflC (stomatin/prohibitin superfamily)
MADQISERDELTLRTLSFIERTTLAEQRRRALHTYAEQARQDPAVAEIVRLMLASRRQRDSGGSNVVELYPKGASDA